MYTIRVNPHGRTAVAMLATALLGSFTVTFLAFEPAVATRFPDFVRRLLGL